MNATQRAALRTEYANVQDDLYRTELQIARLGRDFRHEGSLTTLGEHADGLRLRGAALVEGV